MTGSAVLEEVYLDLNWGITDISTPFLVEIAKKSCFAEMVLWNILVSTARQ